MLFRTSANASASFRAKSTLVIGFTSRLVIFNAYDDGHNLPASEKIDGGNVRALICNQTIVHSGLRSDTAGAPKRDQHVSQLSERRMMRGSVSFASKSERSRSLSNSSGRDTV